MNRPQALFLVALLGVLAVVGTGVYELFGTSAVLVYAVVVTAVVLVGAARARAAVLARREAAGRTCSCCTSSHFDPVQVV